MEIKQIRYISLPIDTFRRKLIERLLEWIPYPSQWVPGVVYEPDNPAFEPYTRFGLAEYVLDQPNRIRGVLGNWIASSKAIEDVVHCDSITVVLEDDFVCTASFFDTALKMIERFERQFDVIMFDCMGTPREEHKIAENVYRSDGCTFPIYWGAHALFINTTSIPRILEAKRISKVMDVDGFFLRPDTGLDVYQFYTGQCRQLWFSSRVSNMDGSPQTDMASLDEWHSWTQGFSRRR